MKHALYPLTDPSAPIVAQDDKLERGRSKYNNITIYLIMKQNHQTIYLEADEQVAFIIDRLRESEAREITLVIPKKAVFFQSIVNLKLLKEQAEKLRKNIAVVTTDEIGKSMAVKAGLAVHRRLEPPEELLEERQIEKVDNTDEKNKEENFNEDKRKVTAQNNEIYKNKLSVSVGGIRPKKEDNIVHLENLKENDEITKDKIDETKNKEAEDLSQDNNDNERQIKQVKMFDIIKKENDLDLGGNDEPSFSHTASQISEEEFDLFPGVSKKRRAISLLPSLSARFFIIFVVVCLAVSAVTASFVLPEAEIVISLKTESATGNFEFTVDKDIIRPDFQSNRLPANTVEVISKESSEFLATGVKQLSEKASGIITIYNEYSTGSQSLMATTRFLSKDGKIFRIKERVIVPGFTKPEDKIIPGAVEAEVFAEEAGEEYNIEPTTFTVPAYKENGNPRYFSIYARSATVMEGGLVKEVTVITETDISKAKKDLLESLKEKNSLGIENEVGEKNKIINNTQEDKVAEVVLSNKIGEQVEKAEITLSVSSKALVVKKTDVDSLVDWNFNAKLSEEMKAVSDFRKIEYGDSYTGDDQEIIFPVYAEQKAVREINVDQIKRDIAGKNERELRDFFSEAEGISSVDVNFWPFWVKNVPQSVKKIKVGVDTNDSL